MIKVEAVIRPQFLGAVQAALQDEGILGMTITEVRGSGKQKGYTQHYRGSEYNVNLLPKVKVEIVVADERAESVVSAIAGAARTGEIGDGKIFLTQILDVVRIRTSERAETAL